MGNFSDLHNIHIKKYDYKFLSLSVKIILNRNKENCFKDEVFQFKYCVYSCYEYCIQFLQKSTKQFDELCNFIWINVENFIYSDVESMIIYLHYKNLH